MEDAEKSYQAFLDGDNDALTAIIREYREGLTFFLNSFVHDSDKAEELMEETFVRLYVKRPKFSGASQFKTWLFGVGRNVAREHLRRSARREQLPLDTAEMIADATQQPEQRVLQEERRMTVRRVLSRLPSAQQQVLWLTYFEGLSNREAARVMKTSEGNVAVRLHRARRALKEELMKEGIDDEI